MIAAARSRRVPPQDAAVEGSNASGYPGSSRRRKARAARPWAAIAAFALLCVQPVGALTLPDAIRMGVATHPAVAAAVAELEAAGTEVAIARDGYWPTVQLSAGPENSLRHEIGYELTARQVLYDWGRVRARIDRASAVERQYLEALEVASNDAALEIANTYLDVLLYQSRLEAADRHAERISALAELSRDRSDSGYSDRGERDRAELELERAMEQRTIENSALLQATSEFHELLSRPAEGLTWPESPGLERWLRSRSGLEQPADDAPLLRQARARVTAARAEYDESRAALKPELNLEGSLLRRELGGNMEEDAVIALRVRMTPFQGLSGFRQAQAAARREEAAQWAMRETRRGLRRELASWFQQIRTLQLRVDSLDSQLHNAGELVNVYREQFDAGLRPIDDLLPVHRELLEAERQLSEVKSEQIRVQYQAAARLGRLGELLDTHPGGVDREEPGA